MLHFKDEKNSNWSKAAEVAIDQGFKQASFHEKNNWNVDIDPKVKRGKSSLATRVMIKTLEWKKI